MPLFKEIEEIEDLTAIAEQNAFALGFEDGYAGEDNQVYSYPEALHDEYRAGYLAGKAEQREDELYSREYSDE
jgi:hypothetical protein